LILAPRISAARGACNANASRPCRNLRSNCAWAVHVRADDCQACFICFSHFRRQGFIVSLIVNVLAFSHGIYFLVTRGDRYAPE
jgi:hypothetical protein